MSKKKPYISGVSKNLAKSISENIEAEVSVRPTLDNKRVGISVSESEDYQELGFSKTHLRDITIELTRYLLINATHLVYGGDLRKEGYTFAFSELAFQYRQVESDSRNYFTNYFGWPIHLALENSDTAAFKRNRVAVVKIEAPSVVPGNLRQSQINQDSIANKYYWAKSMSKMRTEMTKSCDARVFIGGRKSQYVGFYPGIIEEAQLAIKLKQPIYLLGAFGGASCILIRAIKGEKSSKLVDELVELFPESKTLHSYSKKKKDIIPNLSDVLSGFNKFGIKQLMKNNRLSLAQNEILFETEHATEMIMHILIGLRRAFNH